MKPVYATCAGLATIEGTPCQLTACTHGQQLNAAS